MPDDRSPEEIGAGFHYDDTTDDVVFDLPSGERLIRSYAPDGSANYRVARFGRWPFEDENTKPTWKPIHSGLLNQPPDAAIRWANERLTQQPEADVVPAAPP